MVVFRRQAWDDDDPCFVISVAARMLRVHSQTLRYYEREGLLEPARSRGNIRLYSQRDIGKLRQIKYLTEDLGINLAGVQVVLELMDRVTKMEQDIRKLERRLAQTQENRFQRAQNTSANK